MPDRRAVLLWAALAVLTSGVVTTAAAGQLPDQIIPAAEALDPVAPVAPIGPLAQAAAAQPPPKPQHSGLAALVRATGSDFIVFPRRKSTWVILGVGGAAALSVHPFDDEVNGRMQDSVAFGRFFKAGKYVGYGWVQASAAIGLYAIGRYAMEPDAGRRTNKVSHLGFDLLRAQIVTQALTYGVKYAVRRDRPTGECCAFPSGHASVTFATASVLERHFGYRASWPMFAIAGYVSASRLTDNRHFLSDVIFGSALGMATGWTVVGRHGRDNFAILPAPVRGGVAVAGSWTPHWHRIEVREFTERRERATDEGQAAGDDRFPGRPADLELAPLSQASDRRPDF